MQKIIRTIRPLSIAAAILFALGLVLNLLADSVFVRDFIKREINRTLQNSGLQLDFKVISLSYLPPGVDIYGVNIKAAEEGDNLLSASRVELSISWASLVYGEFKIDKLTLQELSTSLPFGQITDNKSSVGQISEPIPVWPPQINLPINELELIEANINLNLEIDDSTPLSLGMQGLNIKLTLESWNDWQMNLDLKRFNLMLVSQHIIKDLQIKSDFKASKGKIYSSSLSLHNKELKADGPFEIDIGLGEPVFDPLSQSLFYRKIEFINIDNHLQVNEANLAILGRLLKAEQGTAGILAGENHFRLNYDLAKKQTHWNIKGKALSTDATLYGFKLLNTETKFHINNDEIKFEDTRVIDKNRLIATGSGKIEFRRPNLYDFDIQPIDLRLSELLSILKVDNFNVINPKLQSKNIQIKGSSLPFEMSVSGQVILEDITSPILGYQHYKFPIGPACQANVNLSINIDGMNLSSKEGYCQSETIKELINVDENSSNFLLNGWIPFSSERKLDLTIELNDILANVLRHFSQFSALGELDITSKIYGPFEDFFISIIARAEKVIIRDQEYSNLVVDGLYSGLTNSLNFNQIKFNPGKDALFSCQNCAFNFDKKLGFNWQLDMENIDRSFVADWLSYYFPPSNVSVDIEKLRGNIKGNLVEFLAADSELSYQLSQLMIAGEKYFSNFSGSYKSTSSKVTIDSAQYELGKLIGKLSISIDKTSTLAKNSLLKLFGFSENSPLKLEFTTLATDISAIDNRDVFSKSNNHLWSFPQINELFKQVELTSDVQLELELAGTLENPIGSLNGTLYRVELLDSSLANISFEGFVNGYTLNIHDIRHSANALRGRMKVDLSKPNLPYQWYLLFNQLDLRALLTSSFAADPRNYAYVSGEWSFEGNLTDWWHSSGNLTIEEVNITYMNESFEQTSSFSLESEQAIEIEIDPETGWNFKDDQALKLRGSSSQVTVKLKENRLPNNMNIDISALMDIAILEKLIPNMELAQGQIILQSSLNGSISEPRIELSVKDRKLDPFNSLEWQALSISHASYPPALTNIKLNLNYSQNRLVINNFSANKGNSGELTVSGMIDFKGQIASGLNINTKKLELQRLEIPLLNSIDLSLTSYLNLNYLNNKFLLKGQVNIDRGESVTDFDIRKQILQTLYRRKYTSSGEQQNTNLDLDIKVTANESIEIRNRSIEATLSADLRVEGNTVEPVIVGEIVTEKGSFIYKRAFNITKGLIVFDRLTSPPNPQLDFKGQVLVDNYNIEIDVSGQASEPKVSFSIDPSTRPDGTTISYVDIISLVNSGQLPSNNETSPVQVASNEALSLVVGFAEGPLEKIFDASGQNFVREVYLDSYLSETEARPVTRLNLPIRINDDLRLVLQLDEDENFKQSFQYSLHENINVSGSIDKKKEDKLRSQDELPADTVIDLKFRFKFD